MSLSLTDPDPTDLTVVARTVLPTEDGPFVVYACLAADGTEHLALVMGEVSGPDERPPLVRLHSECLTGDALGSHRCDCGDQLAAARRAIAAEGRGVVIYLRGHEGRGIGLAAKLRAYQLQDQGLDTVDANLALGLEVDRRDYRPAALVLRHLGVPRVRLLSSNPAKEAALVRDGIEVVERRSLPVPTRPENVSYLRTKRLRMGHQTTRPPADVWAELRSGRVPVQVPDATDPTDAALVERYAPIVTQPGPLVLAQLGQSLDGFIAARTGDAVFVTGEEDRVHLHRLRALVDAVVVGVNTVLTDDCRLTVRAVEGRSPVRVVLDPRARMPRSAHLLTDGDAPTLWFVGDTAAAAEVARQVAAQTPAVDVQVVPLPLADGRFAPRQVLDVLAARGLTRVLVEGGGSTVSAFFAAGVLDRLYLTTAPLLIGDGIPGLRFVGPGRLRDALRAPVRRFEVGEDVCVELDLAAARRAGAAGASIAEDVDEQDKATREHRDHRQDPEAGRRRDA